MDRVSRGFRTKRIFALMLVCIMAVSFMPVIGGQAHSATNESNETCVSDIEALMQEEGEEQTPDDGVVFKAYNTTSAPFFSYSLATGQARITGKAVGGDRYMKITIDGATYKSSRTGIIDLDENVDMKKSSAVGYHMVSVHMKSGIIYSQDYVPTGIYSKPTNSAKRYAAYSRYFDFYTGFDNYSDYYSYDLYVDYKIRGTKNWKRSGRMGFVGQTYKVNGLTPNRYYQARTHFGKWVTYKGKNYFFTSLSTGNGSPIVTFRSGKANKPKIKSVKVKAIKVKKKRGTRYGYYTGLPLGKFTYYKYKIKVTVKLKKRPGTKGIVINGKRFKGNKKKYTFTLGPYTNYTKPKGKKFTVYAYTYDSKTYGGYSPMYKKKKKVR